MAAVPPFDDNAVTRDIQNVNMSSTDSPTRLNEDSDPLKSDWQDLIQRTATILDPKARTRAYWSEKTREDGRWLTQCRPTTVRPGVLARCDTLAGSAHVQLGSTGVRAAVSLQVGTCGGEPRGGDVQVTLAPEHAVLQSFVQRVLTNTLPLEQLVIADTNDYTQDGVTKSPPSSNSSSSCSNMAFRLVVSLQVLESHGNLRDAVLLAGVAAVADVQLPATVLRHDRVCLVPSRNGGRRLQLATWPVSLTLAVWRPRASSTRVNNNNHKNNNNTNNNPPVLLIVDPSSAEETAMHGQISLVVDAKAVVDSTNANSRNILSMEVLPNGSACHNDDQATLGMDCSLILLAVKIAHGRAAEIKPLLEQI